MPKSTLKKWDQVKDQFLVDGSLRDVIVEDIKISTWNRFLMEIGDAGYRYEFLHGDRAVPLPTSFTQIQALQATDPTTLKIFPAQNLQLNCHFFTDNELEMDIDPSEVVDEASYQVLLAFLNWLSCVIERPVKVTHENDPQALLFTVQHKHQ